MIKAVATAVEPAERAAGQAPVQSLYLEALTLVERLHRRLLDVIKDEFDRRGRADINSVQALLLYIIGARVSIAVRSASASPRRARKSAASSTRSIRSTSRPWSRSAASPTRNLQ